MMDLFEGRIIDVQAGPEAASLEASVDIKSVWSWAAGKLPPPERRSPRERVAAAALSQILLAHAQAEGVTIRTIQYPT